MRENGRIHPKHLLISTDLPADLGNQVLRLTLSDLLVFSRENALSDLVVMSLVEQAPAIVLIPVAGVWMDRVGGKMAHHYSPCSGERVVWRQY